MKLMRLGLLENMKTRAIIKLTEAIEDYQNSLGSTLFERVKNQFLNRPLIVICAITISAVTVILIFLKLIGLL
jgi:hypothetical protein